MDDGDETARLRLALEHADRLAALGRMAAVLGHELNNPVCSAVLCLEVVRRELGRLYAAGAIGDGHPSALVLRDVLQDLETSLMHVSELVADARSYADTRAREPEPLDVVEIGRGALRMMRVQIVDVARLIVDLRPVPPVRGHRHRLVQVVVNLLSNALTAVRSAPTTTRNTIGIRTEERGGHVRLIVEDDGPGVCAEVASTLFAPLVSSRDAASSGLGLWLSANIVADHGGTLQHEVPDGGGARFVIALPALSG